MKTIPRILILLSGLAVGVPLILESAEPTPGAADQIVWAAWQIPAEKVVENGPLAIVPDEQAESKRESAAKETGKKTEESVALLRRVSRQAIAKAEIPVAATPPVPWSRLRPGLYRVSARVKFDGDVNIIGTPLQLFVHPLHIGPNGEARPIPEYAMGGQASAHSFYGFDYKEPNRYQVLSFLYEVDPTGTKRLKARVPISPMAVFSSTWARDPKQKPPEEPKPADGIVIGLRLPRTKYSAETGMPPNSLRTVSLDWVKIERVEPSPSLTVRYVRPEKRWMRPGDKTSFDIGIENFTAAPQKKRLTVTLARGFAERTALHEEEIALGPGERKTITVPWQTARDTPIWGYEVQVEVRSGDRADSSARDFFSVHPRAYHVHIMGANFHTEDPFRERGNCQNLLEMFGATPGDMARVTSPAEQWIGGMMSVPYSYAATRKAVEDNAALGAQTVMYLFAGGTGTPVMDLYVRKPEWFSERMYGTDLLYRKLRGIEEMVGAFNFQSNFYQGPMVPHVELGMNFWDPAQMDMITKDTVEFVRKAGYRGIRFDVGMFGPKSVTACYGEKLPYDMKDAMQVGARNFTNFCAALRQADPNFEFGANMDSWAYLENVGKRNQTPPDPETYPEFVAFARAGGMFMDEGSMSAPLYHHYMNRFEDALWSMCQKREMARRYGGIYQLFSPHRDGSGHFAHDDIYWAIMVIASGSYYVGNFSAVPYSEDGVGPFIVRFAEYYRSLGLKPLPNAADQILVDAPGNVWYADTAACEDIGNRRRYVVPLINPPVNERLRRNKSNELPPPMLDPFPVDVKVPEGYARAKAWMLTWEPRVQAVPLDVALDGGHARVKFPGLQLFRTLVMEFEKGGG